MHKGHAPQSALGRLEASMPGGGDAWREEPLEFLESRRDLVATLLGVDNLLAGHPIQLDRATWSRERLVAMPGIVGALEDQKRAAVRRHFGDIVVEIVGPAKQAQPTGVFLPALVDIEKHGDDLGGRIGVD